MFFVFNLLQVVMDVGTGSGILAVWAAQAGARKVYAIEYTNMAKHAGLPWDCVLSAEVFKAYKPHPDTYLGVARVFDVPPEQVALVATHHDDLAAARACGLRTAYIERPLELGAARPKDGTPQPGNDLHAKDLNDLAQMLGC